MGQSLSNERAKEYTQVHDTVSLDSFPIVPNSIKIFQNSLPIADTLYDIDYINSLIVFKSPISNVRIIFRTFPRKLDYTIRRKDPKYIYKDYQPLINPFTYTPGSDDPYSIDASGLEMRGLLSRGIGVGNTQSLVVNSNLNLQISGKINNDVEVKAAISDDNNPIQADGSSRQVQDFDKVYIELSKNKTRVVLGDFQMKRPAQSYFTAYDKKSRGVQFDHGWEDKKNAVKYTIGGEGAISRGRFSRNTFNGQEGNQGPYRLSGTNGELYIIILSGTEKVYLDGLPMVRGEQDDYIIDYNTGEVTFMPRRLINSYSRIVVEFQYSDRNYARVVYTMRAGAQIKKHEFFFNHYTEKDLKNQPYQQTLSDEQKLALANAGNDPSQTKFENAIANDYYDKTKLLYNKYDSIINGDTIKYYKYASSEGKDTPFYQLAFSYVGQGRGSYNIASSGANGRVFKWVGQLHGSYEPIQTLITPKQMQMTTLTHIYIPNAQTKIEQEIAVSNRDKNTFSSKDDGNNQGLGYRLKVFKAIKLNKNLKIDNTSSWEFVNKNFRYIERYRNVEFDRSWERTLNNKTFADTGFREHIVMSRFNMLYKEYMRTSYQFSLYQKDNFLKGIAHALSTDIQVKRWTASGNYNTTGSTVTQNDIAANSYKTWRAELGRTDNYIKYKVYANSERSTFKYNTSGDSLLYNSFNYDQYGAGINNNDTLKTQFGLNYFLRKDKTPVEGKFIDLNASHNLDGTFKANGKAGRLDLSLNFRRFINDTVSNNKVEDNTLFRGEYQIALFKRTLYINSFFQTGNGRELKKQFTYQEVQPGNGIYQWNDYNEDSIQQLNEFEVAVYKDKARFIKIFLPTNEYVKTNITRINQTITWEPYKLWEKKKGVLKLLSYFSNTTNVRVEQKNQSSKFELKNPFSSIISDTGLITLSGVLRHVWFINKYNNDWGAEFGYIQNGQKQLLTTGIEAKQKKEQYINLRKSIGKSWQTSINILYGDKALNTELFEARNYHFYYTDLQPALQWQPSQDMRLKVYYHNYNARNKYNNDTTKTLTNEITTEFKYLYKNNGSLQIKFSYNNIKFNGDANSPIGFEMLNGLLNGNNIIWGLAWEHRLAKNTQLSIVYDGRKSEQSKAVHIARVEARYIF